MDKREREKERKRERDKEIKRERVKGGKREGDEEGKRDEVKERRRERVKERKRESRADSDVEGKHHFSDLPLELRRLLQPYHGYFDSMNFTTWNFMSETSRKCTRVKCAFTCLDYYFLILQKLAI